LPPSAAHGQARRPNRGPDRVVPWWPPARGGRSGYPKEGEKWNSGGYGGSGEVVGGDLVEKGDGGEFWGGDDEIRGDGRRSRWWELRLRKRRRKFGGGDG